MMVELGDGAYRSTSRNPVDLVVIDRMEGWSVDRLLSSKALMAWDIIRESEAC